MPKIAHLIHPVVVHPNSDLVIAQPITFESMVHAKKFTTSPVEVELVAAKYSDEQNIISEAFSKTADITHSIYDIKQFNHPTKKLAIIKDLLGKLYKTTNADYYIYTNVDIGLMPYFYDYIYQLIEEGYDAIAVNRRTISSRYTSPAELWKIYGDTGVPHEGIDCFVFSKSAYLQYEFFDAFIGTGPVGLGFIANMIPFAKKFIWLEKEHLTFHIGDYKSWADPKHADYEIENFKEVLMVCRRNIEKIKADAYKVAILEEIIQYANQRIDQLLDKTKVITANPKQLIHYYSQGKLKKIIAPKVQQKGVRKTPIIAAPKSSNGFLGYIKNWFNQFSKNHNTTKP